MVSLHVESYRRKESEAHQHIAGGATWHAPTLILHGEEDFLVSVQQANLLSESLEAAKKPYRFVLYPNSGHYLPSEDVRRTVTAFLKEVSGSACRARAS